MLVILLDKLRELACNCNPATFESEFWSDVGSKSTGGYTPHKERNLTKHWNLTET